MNDLPDFESIVHYVKQGLRRKTPLSQIKSVLSGNKLASVTIDKAVIVAIDELDQERQELEKPKTEERIIGVKAEENVKESKGQLWFAAGIFVAFVLITILIGSSQMKIIQKSEGVGKFDAEIESIGFAFRGLFLNSYYMECCMMQLEQDDLIYKDAFDICSIGAKNFEDYEVLHKDKVMVEKILDRIDKQCAELGKQGYVCSDRTGLLMAQCLDKKIDAGNYPLKGLEQD